MEMDLAMAKAVLPHVANLDDGTVAYIKGLMSTLAGAIGTRRR